MTHILYASINYTIIWTNAGIHLLSTGPLGTNFCEIFFEIYAFSFKKMHWYMEAILSQPQCVNVSTFIPPHLPSRTLSLFLTHWGRATHICISKLTIIGSDNGLSADRHQAIIWTNAGLLLIGPLGTNLSEILIEILTFSFTKMRLKVSSAKQRTFCLGLNELILDFSISISIFLQ